MANEKDRGAIGDGGSPSTMQTDPNGAQTAVGVPHPENRLDGGKLPALKFPDVELDDYDDDNQEEPALDALPPNQDSGESFPDIVDVGETAEEHEAQGHRPRLVNLTDELSQSDEMKPTVDNQTNQPDRFHNREPKGTAG